MSHPSKARRVVGYSPTVIGILPIPDPRSWPIDVRNWYRRATCDHHCSVLDVFIFHHGSIASMCLQDAITAVGVIDIAPSEWHTESSFPLFRFAAEMIGDYSRRLELAGYAVRVLEPVEASIKRQTARAGRGSRPAAVIDIASARSKQTLPAKLEVECR